ncbi:glycosyltransferase family 2 protein [Cytobacillus firmus]|uniref:glycosyltransferase family 2 protein n=1 Tax=Cytobacillus pseudoceanisediminis TaxID=3051614 RepID=UPI0021638180|nr:glycosyltransferase family 2 protein [Cytobacillus firmus]
MYSLSVILPIYNVESYLSDCLESILKSMNYVNQDKKIEIILVDDGSTDNSSIIAKDYAFRYKFIYLKKKNGGLSDARNFGLKYVSSDFVTFIDSDDKVTENYFSKILQALESNPDMVIFNWCDFFYNEPHNTVKGMDNPKQLWSVQPSAWNKVYKTKFFEEILFPIGKLYEDVGTIYKILSKVNEFIYIDEPLYMYRKGRQNSLLTTISPKINDIYYVLDETYNFYSSSISTNQEIKDGLCYQYIKLLMWSNMYRQIKFHRYNFWGLYKKMKYSRSLINSRFPEWKSNELIKLNSIYFINRFGKDYIKMIDNIGRDFSSTLYTLLIIIFKNFRRK